VTVKASCNRVWAIFLKEVHQMRRDKLTFGMLFGIPIIQIILFGYAINTDPKLLPTAVHAEEQTPIIRTLLAGMKSSGYFDFVGTTSDPRESAGMLTRGEVAFVVSFPIGFTEQLVRGDRPQVLVEADATDPAAASNAIGNLNAIFTRALNHDLTGPLRELAAQPPPYELVIHPKYNPEGITQYNIVPGLLGVILTLTLVMIMGMSMAREVERGTMENLLAFPAEPHEVMLGKIAPYVAVGATETIVILTAAKVLFGVPFVGSFFVLLLGIAIFMVANLAVGFTFSTLTKSQLQAMQITILFFLPSLLLSGFMFPFRGMPEWAQNIGEVLPLTHFLRVVRGVMLKGSDLADVQQPMFMMTGFTVFVCVIAMLRYRRTLD
jgi:ABC-2 type transport system permease protein